MDRYRTFRASLLATPLIFAVTSGVYAQRWEQGPAPSESTTGWTVKSDDPVVPHDDHLVKVPLSSAVPLILRGQNEYPAFGTQSLAPPSTWIPDGSSAPVVPDRPMTNDALGNFPPDQIGTPSDIPNIVLPPIPSDSTSILSAPDVAYLDQTQFVFGAKGDVFNGKATGRDDGILLKSWNGWDHDYDPGIVWHGHNQDALCYDFAQLHSVCQGNSVNHFNISEGAVARGNQHGTLRIGDNGVVTIDSGVKNGFVGNGPITTGSVTIGDAFGPGGQKHDHYYLKDGKRNYMQYTWPDKTAPKMEERVGTSDVWLINGSTAPPKK